MDILGVYETRWINNEEFTRDKHRIIYASREKNERLILNKDVRKCDLGYW